MQTKQPIKYPALQKAFPYPNFSVITSAIETHFSDLFDLSLLNTIAETNDEKLKTTTVYRLFQICMKALHEQTLIDKQSNYTVNEIVEKLALIFNDDSFRDSLFESLVFVADNTGLKGEQLSYLERLAAKTAKPAEALSFIDMLRFVSIFQATISTIAPPVFNLKNLLVCPDLSSCLSKNPNIIVNLNQESGGQPKWAALHHTEENTVRIYCEATLLETEKKQLSRLLRKNMPQDKEVTISYEGEAADGGISSGYLAVTWLKEVIKVRIITKKHGGNDSGERLNLSSNFWSMREAFLAVLYNKFSNNFNVNHSTFHSKQVLGFFLINDLLAAQSISLNSQHDILLAGKNFPKSKADQKKAEKQAEFFSQTGTFIDNKKQMEADHALISDEEKNSLALKLPADLSSYTLSWRKNNATNENKAHQLFLAVFNDAARRRKSFTVDASNYPAFALDDTEQAYILSEMEYNSFIQKFEIKGNDPSLTVFHAKLKPILARNTWLAFNHYKAPVMGDHWQAAMRAWVKYLYQNPQSLSNDLACASFKEAVNGMGFAGLSKLLSHLNSHRDTIEMMMGDTKSPFYLGMASAENCQALTQHLNNPNSYFPFNQIGIDYDPAAVENLNLLLTSLNQRDQFSEVQLMNIPQEDEEKVSAFLKELAKQAFEQKWTIPIVIEGFLNHEAYCHLNNIILCNRREKLGNAQVQSIEKIIQPKTEAPQQAFLPEPLPNQIDFTLNFGDNTGPWPLHRDGTVQLQLQYQQQRQQQQQLQQQKQNTQLTTSPEVALQGKLISYANINELLTSYLESLKREFPTLQNTDINLQTFFADLISANPKVNAPHIIHYMTEDTAKYLLRQYLTTNPRGGRLSFGLNTQDQLSKGLFTERTQNGELVLCYAPDLEKEHPLTPLTLDLDFLSPKASVWQGDFRQFDLAHYLANNNPASVTHEDLTRMAAFAALQSPDVILEAFKKTLSSDEDKADLKKATEWWILQQAEQYAGEAGKNALKNNSISSVTPHEALKLLLRNEEAVTKQFDELNLSDHEVRALGQLYYRFGTASVALLVEQLNRILKTFPHHFEQFKQAFLTPCEDMSLICSPASIAALQAICQELTEPSNQAWASIWWKLTELHAKAAGFERIETLWEGFQYFVAQLSKEGVDINNPGAFEKLNPNNMLVWMNRVLTCVQKIPSGDQKQILFDHIDQYDFKQGGLPYALQYEGFKRFDKKLKLTQFEQGYPTYAPGLENVFSWPDDGFSLQIQRLIATQSGLSEENYKKLCDHFTTGIPKDRAAAELICLLLTDHSESYEAAIDSFSQLPKTKADQLKLIAQALHKTVYKDRAAKPSVSLETILAIINQEEIVEKWQKLPENLKVPFLEAVTILNQRGAIDESVKLIQLMETYQFPDNYSLPLIKSAYQLAALYGQYDEAKIDKFIQATTKIGRAVQEGLSLTITQLLSIDWQATHIRLDAKDWNNLIEFISAITDELHTMSEKRMDFISELTNKGVIFKHSLTGDLRALTNEDKANIDLSLFVDHETRLWKFLQDRIIIPVDKSAEEGLSPLLTLLKQLQLKRGYVNEIEHLLLAIEKISSLKEKQGVYWHADYFCQLLEALQPENDRAAYPVNLLKALLEEPLLTAKSLNELPAKIPAPLREIIKTIAHSSDFTNYQQKQLCQLALHEFSETEAFSLTREVLTELSNSNHSSLRSDVLNRLTDVKDKGIKNAEEVWRSCEKLLKLRPIDKNISSHWSKTCDYWLQASNGRETEQNLFAYVMGMQEDKKMPLLHILGFSTLQQGLKSSRIHEEQLARKGLKLARKLDILQPDDLSTLVKYYPTVPSPDAEDLLRILKISKTPGQTIQSALQAFEKNSHADLRADYANLAVSREADFERLLNETQISTKGGDSQPLTNEQKQTLRKTFDDLKKIESGEIKFEAHSMDKPVAIKDMTRDQLRHSFKNLSRNNLTDEQITFRWAICFEALGRVSKKYPHLAQQFSLLVDDIFANNTKKVAVLDTGEGKSHFNALRAINHVAKKKKAHIHTAKRTLAERDQKEYEGFFDYLGISSCYLSPDSPAESLKNHEIIYTTTGDFSLFLDRQSYEGQPVTIDENWVGIFDEIDFIRFEEGLSTEYNFSIPDGKTPEQMRWFYHVLNKFCEKHQDSLSQKQGIDVSDLKTLVKNLVDAAGQNTSKQNYIARLVKEPLQLVRWVHAAYEAGTELKVDNQFYVSEKDVIVQGEEYPLREIIPLSSDNQSAAGSTFSGGAQQLLAEKLNTQAMQTNEAQNFHLPVSSDMLSSQVADSCIPRWYQTWEGATGSLSSQQAAALGTDVIRMPTNQPCLRDWKPAQFSENHDEKLSAIADQVKACLNKNESILFTCKNDQSVKNLYSALKERLSPEEFDQLICLTNDSEKSTSIILEEKKQKEAWKEGKKHKGACLLASSLGRGDNVAVEAVFIVDLPKDENDVIQKGGRTARNGAAGTVYQFYSLEEMQPIYAALKTSLTQQDSAFVQQISESIQNADLHTKMLKELLAMQERMSFLNNQTSKQYREAKAEYSHWTLSILAQLANNPSQKAIFQQQTILSLKKVDEAWLTISSNTQTRPDEKINAIREKIHTFSKQLLKNVQLVLNEAKLTVDPFKLEKNSAKETENISWNSKEFSEKSPEKSNLNEIIEKIADRYLDNNEDKSLFSEQISKVKTSGVDDATILHWLAEWEKLARNQTKKESGSFLMDLAQVMQQCNTPQSIQAFNQLLQKTLDWWNKGNQIYQSTFTHVWKQLAKHLQAENSKPFLELMAPFNLAEPGKIGFTWLSVCMGLSSDTLAKHWTEIKSLIEIIRELPIKKQQKTALLNKIISTIETNPEKMLSPLQIKAVITSFLDNYRTHQEAIQTITRSDLLLLPYLSSEIEALPNELETLNETIIHFLAKTSWSSEQIDSYLKVLNKLLSHSNNPGALAKNLSHFQEQYCDKDFQTTFQYLEFLDNDAYLQNFLESDELLNQRFTEFFNFFSGNKPITNYDQTIYRLLADFYLDENVHFPEPLAKIFVKFIEIEKDIKIDPPDLYKSIFELNKFSEKKLDAIENKFSTLKPVWFLWLLNDLPKLLAVNSEDNQTEVYLDKLEFFYDGLSKLEKFKDAAYYPFRNKNFYSTLFSSEIADAGDLRQYFEKLNSDQANEILTLVEKNPAKISFIPHLMSFFPLDKQHPSIKFLNSNTLAEIFLLYERKSPKDQKNYEPQMWGAVKLIKDFSRFSNEQLKNLFTQIENKDIKEIDFILQSLKNISERTNINRSISDLINCYGIITSIQNDKEKKAALTACCLALRKETISEFLTFINREENNNIFQKCPESIKYVAEIFHMHFIDPQALSRIFLLGVDHIDAVYKSNATKLGQADKNISAANELQAWYQLLKASYKNAWNSNLPQISSLLPFIEENPKYVVHLVSDQFFKIYQNLTNEEKKSYKDIAASFYKLLRKHKILEVNTHLTLPKEARKTFLKEKLNLEKNKFKWFDQTRIYFTRLVMQKAFIPADESSENFILNHLLISPWLSNNRMKDFALLTLVNNNLLGKIYEEYATQAKLYTDINNEALSVSNKASLLTLAAELNFAQTSFSDKPLKSLEQDKMKGDTGTETNTANEKINHAILEYENISDKSTTRNQQFQDFKNIFQEYYDSESENRPKGEIGEGINYLKALETISAHRKIAIDADIAENQDNWFKLNRKGNSRYLDMLTKLENIVLQRFATDAKAMKEFHLYKPHFESTLNDAVKSLLAAFTNDKNERKFTSRLKKFNSNKPRTATLLLAELKQRSPDLPGHLKTLADPLIENLEVWLTYQDNREHTDEKKLSNLFLKISQLVDDYDTLGDKSDDRAEQVTGLKKSLFAAMMGDTDTGCLGELKTVISEARETAISKDREYSQNFFPPHYRGDSRYLNLLRELDNLVIDSNNLQENKNSYLQGKLETAKTVLKDQLNQFYEEKKDSIFWKKTTLEEIDQLNNLLTPSSLEQKAVKQSNPDLELLDNPAISVVPEEQEISVKKLVFPKKNEISLEDEPDPEVHIPETSHHKNTKVPPKKDLTNQINTVLPHLPGYLQVLAREVLAIEEELNPQKLSDDRKNHTM